MVLSKVEIEDAKKYVILESLVHESRPSQKRLDILKQQEPSSDKPFFRLAIIGYEITKSLGSLERAIVYAERFKNNPELYNQEIKNAQLEIGDCFVQLIMLCKTYNFDVWKTLELGVKHLEERHIDFEEKGWSEA